MIEYNFYSEEEFNNLEEDIKWDMYNDLVFEFKRKVKENERQYNLIINKQGIINNLKEILYSIIDSFGSDDYTKEE